MIRIPLLPIPAVKMLKVFILGALFCLILAQEQRSECCEEYCYGSDSDRPQTTRFASKSVYQVVRGVDMSRHSVIPSEWWWSINKPASAKFILINLNCNYQLIPADCQPVKFWMMARHGTRLPSAKDMKTLKTLIDVSD